MRLFAFLSLRQWLTLPYIALIFGVATLIGGLSYRTGSQAVDTVANHLLRETVARIGQAVDRHIVGSGAALEAAFPNGMPAPVSVADEMAAMRTRFWIATSLHIDPNNYVYYGNQQGEFFGLWRFNLQDAELRLKLDAKQPRKLFHFTGINGELAKPEIEQKMYEPRIRPWYKVGETNRSHSWTSIYIDFRNDELVATRARRVLDAKGDFQGVVATDLSLKRLNDFVRGLSISPNAVAFIIEEDGKLIASSRSANIAQLADGTSARVNADSGESVLQRSAYEQVCAFLASGAKLDHAVTQRFDGPEGESIEIAFERVRDDAGLDWIIVVAMPRSDFMQGVTGNVQRALLIGILGAIAAVLLGLTVLGWVGRDLRQLAEAAREIGEGDLDSPLGIKRKDEIGLLANAFRQMQNRLRTDALTGLDNRDVMVRNIGRRIERAGRSDHVHPFAVLFVDLNNFKQINDRYGHDAGDDALIEVSRRLRDAVRSEDRVARYAGDEFVLLISEVPSPDAAERIRQHIEEVLGAPLPIGSTAASEPVGAGGAVGMALFPGDADSADQLIKYADRDMYSRKAR